MVTRIVPVQVRWLKVGKIWKSLIWESTSDFGKCEAKQFFNICTTVLHYLLHSSWFHFYCLYYDYKIIQIVSSKFYCLIRMSWGELNDWCLNRPKDYKITYSVCILCNQQLLNNKTIHFLLHNVYSKLHCVVVKIATIGTQTQNFHPRVRRSAGLSFPGRDIDFMSCSVFICALRIALSIPFH